MGPGSSISVARHGLVMLTQGQGRMASKAALISRVALSPNFALFNLRAIVSLAFGNLFILDVWFNNSTFALFYKYHLGHSFDCFHSGY